MSLRFSDHGPEFPSALIDDLMSGEVVFLCGAGISAPQIPDFKLLVDRVYADLGMEMDRSEKCSYCRGSYEEVLGALSRRVADPKAMHRTVAEILQVPSAPNLDQHRTILRLSRDLGNRVTVVTTNFDTLLERALDQPKSEIRSQSFAGQSLPAPGRADFGGIIHIHGRLSDAELDVDATQLVLTSSEYGDAYMRSGWASRFLFDLARCKTIVLIGYSASDAPVRYFLNVLEADRSRFPDLRSVYALDCYEKAPVEAEEGWGTLAVTALPYCKLNPKTGAHDHSPLWDDLRKLAEIVERPKRNREERARIILVGNSKAITPQQLQELTWLFTGHSDLWPVMLTSVSDPHWFHIFQENKLWSQEDAAWVISAWVAQDFESRQRFATAVEWHKVLGRKLLARLDNRLWQNAPTSPIWLKAWQLLFSAKRVERIEFGGSDRSLYSNKRKLESGLVLEADLAKSVAMCSPSIIVKDRPWAKRDEDDAKDATAFEGLHLPDLAWWQLDVTDEHGASELVGLLNELDEYSVRILELGSAALRSALRTMVDLEKIFDRYDSSDFSVPSIEDHDQNSHHGGLLFLVRIITNALPKAVSNEPSYVRQLVAEWGTWPGRLGIRLRLHALRDPATCSADEALGFILELGEHNFWAIRREIALVLRERSKDAQLELLESVEARVRGNGEEYYAQYSIENEQLDWRPHARDTAVWLRLKMLEAADALSEAGRAELDVIILRRNYLDRPVEDSDFFGSYSSGVRTVEGDSTPISEAAPDSRLDVAVELSNSPDVDRRLGWNAYCRADPKGAFEALRNAGLTPPNIELWGALLETLAFQKDGKDEPLRRQIVIASLKNLELLDVEALIPIADNIVDVLSFGHRSEIEQLEDWCDRLWIALTATEFEIDFDQNLFELAINRAAGRLVRIMIAEFDRTRQELGPNEDRQLSRLTLAASHNGSAGAIARAILVDALAYILQAARSLADDYLGPKLTADDDEGRALRAVLVSQGKITPEISKAVSQEVLRGVAEWRPGSGNAFLTVSGILRPAVAAIRNDEPGRWGISEAEVRNALRDASPEIRVGAIKVLVQWMHQYEGGAEEAWQNMIEPVFARVWPKDRNLLDAALNLDLIALAVGAGKFFPEALETLRYYFSPYEGGRSSIFPLKNSEALDKFPDHVLDLLWQLFGPTGNTDYEMAKVLDSLLVAKPGIEVDRRFQSLELRTSRFG